MTRYFDTSVLVAALVQAERSHAACLRDLAAPARRVTSAHTIGELFATLTSGRLPLQFSPNDAEQSIQMNIVPSFEIIPFSASDYLAVVSNCGRVGARGGAFFDVLHLHAARSAQADEILTLNDGHFAAFGPDLIARLRKPQ